MLNASVPPVVPGGAGSAWNAGALPRAAQHSLLTALIRNSFSQQYSRDERRPWFQFFSQIIGVKIVIDSLVCFSSMPSGNNLRVKVVFQVPKSSPPNRNQCVSVLLVPADSTLFFVGVFVLLWVKGSYSEKLKKAATVLLAN